MRASKGMQRTTRTGQAHSKLESRAPDSKTVLLVHDSWWDERKHNIDRLEFVPITPAATRIGALLSGEVDLIDSAPMQDLERLKADPSIDVQTLTELRTVFVAMNRRATLPDGRLNRCASPIPA